MDEEKPALRRAPPKQLAQALVDNAPWAPIQANERAAAALKALKRGDATGDQQQYVLEWLVQEVCKTHDMSYRPGELGAVRDEAFAEGKRWVGNQFLKHLHMDMKIFQRRARGT